MNIITPKLILSISFTYDQNSSIIKVRKMDVWGFFYGRNQIYSKVITAYKGF